MNLLNICIPTYNRTKELIYLWNSFLSIVQKNFDREVQIFIYDNSDDDVAKLNYEFFKNRVNYVKNERNLGFSVNVLNCALTDNSEYLWCLSDNDFIQYHYFEEIIQLLKRMDIDCLFLPYTTVDFFDELKFQTIKSYNTLGEFIKIGKELPFVLLSNAIIKNKSFNSIEIEGLFFNNSFIQIPLFIDKVGMDGKIFVFNKSVINYNFEYNGRFNITELFHSKNQVIEYLNEKYDLNIPLIKNWNIQNLKFVLYHSVNLLKIHEYENSRKVVLTNLKNNMFSIKYPFLVLLIFLPKFIRVRYVALTLTKHFLKDSLYTWGVKYNYILKKMKENES